MEEELIKLVYKFNEHWETGKTEEEYQKALERKKYSFIFDYIDERQIIALTGLRRTGKTVMMHQIIDFLLKNGVEKKNIFYFSFDEELTRKGIIEDLIEYYENNILKKDMRKTEKSAYIFFDEIQYVEKWQAVLKRYYDLNYKIKFIISGSSSLFITKKAKESLAGRIYDFVIHPLTFQEYLLFKDIKIGIETIDFESIKKVYEERIVMKERIKSLFDEYIIRGGFPENVFKEELKKVQEYISNAVIEKIIYKDLPKTFKIKNPDLLFKILQVISRYSSELLSIENISKTLNVNRNVISEYLFYLEKSFLVAINYNYTKSLVKQLRTSKKGYVNDSGIINTILKYGQEILAYPEIVSKLVETIVFSHVRQKYKTYFFRDKQKREVDIIAINSKLIPIEVKYQTAITRSDMNNLIFFMGQKELERGMIVTKDILREEKINGKSILLVPAWLFLLAF